MALTVAAHKALTMYVERADIDGPAKQTIVRAVALTLAQKQAAELILREYWGQPSYACPSILDLKPQHGYRSRVQKDNYPSPRYVEWLVAGCADVAAVRADPSGRPQLLVAGVEDETGHTYDLLVPIRSDVHGYVHIDDVIPKGLPPRQKKTAPSAFPKTVP